MNCNDLPDDDLLLFVFGELDASRQAAVERALREDADLAARAQALAAAIAAVQAENPPQPSDEFNERLRQRLPEVLACSETTMTCPTALFRSQGSWRWIMRHPVSRATAAIFVLALVGAAVWFHGGGATPALADFLRPIREAKTLKFKITTKWTSLSPQQKLLPVETQQSLLQGMTSVVMMLGTDRSRMEMLGPDQSATIEIWDGRQGKQLCLIPGQKRATLYEHEPSKDPAKGPQDAAAGYRALLLGTRDQSGQKLESLGAKQIDGQQTIGVRLRRPEVVMDIWGDPQTGLPVRIEATAILMPNVQLIQSDFEFNIPMDEALFSVEPPAGYQLGNFFIQTPTGNGSATKEEDLLEALREASRLNGGQFPPLLDQETLTGLVYAEYSGSRLQQPGAAEEVRTLQGKFQRGLLFQTLLPPEADAHYAGRGVSLGTAERAIFWYRPKDSQTYRVIDADLKVREAQTLPHVPEFPPEQDLIELFQNFSELSGGPFPKVLESSPMIQQLTQAKSISDLRYQDASSPQAGYNYDREGLEKLCITATVRLKGGLAFLAALTPEADVHYAGRGVSRGAAERPIFWYRPAGSAAYRVIYGDFSIRDANTPPDVAIAPPEQDLIDTLRFLCHLGDGGFPDQLSTNTMGPLLIKLLGLTGVQKPNAAQTRELTEAAVQSLPGIMFAEQLPAEADAHYAGKGVSLGAAERPVFWHRPKGAKAYRVLYGDLSIREAETPPDVPDAQRFPEPKEAKP